MTDKKFEQEKFSEPMFEELKLPDQWTFWEQYET